MVEIDNKNNRKTWTDEDDIRLINDYKNNVQIENIANALGRSVLAVQLRLIRKYIYVFE
jgi:hypothetical protein